MIKLLIWGVIGYFLYQYFQNKFALKQGDRRDAIHRRPPAEENKKSKEDDEEYIDYEELK